MGSVQRVLITGSRAPVALHLARLLAVAGHQVMLADTVARPLAAASRMVAASYQVPSFQTDAAAARAMLTGIIAQQGISVVIPTCEEILHLGAMWAKGGMGADLFAPDIALLRRVHNKAAFIALCHEIGLDVPRTHLVATAQDRDAYADRSHAFVFKPVWSRFGSEVLIRPDRNALRAIRPTTTRPWVAQEYMHGTELCVYAVAHWGRIAALSAYRGLVRAGQGAAVCFAPVDTGIVRPFVERFVQATGWRGQVSFDLMQTEDGRILPLECNPRATSGLHLFTDAAAFAGALLGNGPEVLPDVGHPLAVRMALWLYGMPMVLRQGDRAVFRDALRRAGDVMDWPDDKVGLGPQLRSVAEFAGIALRHRIGLQRASTWGIEWNGDG